MPLLIYGIVSVLMSIIINASVGRDRGMSYFDMILTGVLFTPLMPLFICVTAWVLDRAK